MAQPVSLSTIRVAGRAANSFVLDLVKLGSYGRDIIDPLIRAAVMHANQNHLIRDPEMARRYAGLEPDVPDELRRPASINAMSASLRLPYETVRRRIAAIAETGGFVVKPEGVIVPRAVSSSPFFHMAITVQYEKVRGLFERLRAAGALEDPQGTAAPYEGDAPPLRLTGRLVAEYVLRFNEPLAEHIGDVVTGIVLLDLIAANTERLPDDEAGDDTAGAAGFVADAQRRPETARGLAERLGMSHETVRRHVMKLEEMGLAVHETGGWIVPAETLARPQFLHAMLENRTNLARLFGALADYGVLAAWERERQGRAA